MTGEDKCSHQWGGWLYDWNNEAYRICEKCGECDDSRRTPEGSV